MPVVPRLINGKSGSDGSPASVQRRGISPVPRYRQNVAEFRVRMAQVQTGEAGNTIVWLEIRAGPGKFFALAYLSTVFLKIHGSAPHKFSLTAQSLPQRQAGFKPLCSGSQTDIIKPTIPPSRKR